jgi:hypothetical protein
VQQDSPAPPIAGPPVIERTVAGRLSQFRRLQRLISWVGAGLLAELTVFTAVKLTTPPSAAAAPIYAIAAALVPTFVLAAGGFLTFARADVEWRGDVLERHLNDIRDIGAADDIDQIDPNRIRPLDIRWSTKAVTLYFLELASAALGFVCLIVVIWWPVLFPTAPSATPVVIVTPTGGTATTSPTATSSVPPSAVSLPAGATTPATGATLGTPAMTPAASAIPAANTTPAASATPAPKSI